MAPSSKEISLFFKIQATKIEFDKLFLTLAKEWIQLTFIEGQKLKQMKSLFLELHHDERWSEKTKAYFKRVAADIGNREVIFLHAKLRREISNVCIWLENWKNYEKKNQIYNRTREEQPCSSGLGRKKRKNEHFMHYFLEQARLSKEARGETLPMQLTTEQTIETVVEYLLTRNKFIS